MLPDELNEDTKQLDERINQKEMQSIVEPNYRTAYIEVNNDYIKKVRAFNDKHGLTGGLSEFLNFATCITLMVNTIEDIDGSVILSILKNNKIEIRYFKKKEF